ncbi:hypothetical protein [Streptomyces sp. NPDC057748]|uniref:hypothetical protein n=1 Tax=unclassified Streptomyces TaxID=2593676 RepID=UPI00368EFA74
MGTHIGRSWDGPGDIEAMCPCPKGPCGLVDRDTVDETCEQHPTSRMKTIRTRHSAEDCPGVGRVVVVAMKRTYEAREAVIREAMSEAEGYYSIGLLDALDGYRVAVEHEAAERIRAHSFAAHETDGADAAADFVDPGTDPAPRDLVFNCQTIGGLGE